MSPSGASDPDPHPILPYARQWIDESDIAAVADVLRSDFLTQGPAIERFERALCATTGASHAVAVSSGTAALHLACLALDFGPGRTGVTSPITFAASANCFLYAGGAAAFADVDPATGALQPAALDERLHEFAALGAPPGVVVAVSLAGRAAALPELAAVCARHGWTLVEDAAHSLGATYRDPATGATRSSASCTHTRAAILSFHPVKHICAGEGGAIVTNDAALAQRLRRLRTHGIEKPDSAELPAGEGGWFYEQRELGYHYRMTDIQAALGASQLARLPEFLARRREIARGYAESLTGAPFDRVLRAPAFEGDHAYHLYVVHFRSRELRRAAYDFLAARGIRSQVHYIPVYRHPHYRRVSGEIRLPGAESWYEGCLSLPLFPKMTVADQARVVDALRAFAQTHG
ncbi:MAG: UDP-4-amino-4,6-dideoxy-N-acetyl-beta-L-altrosamine transaminase [Opitutaceae bacterium]|nr:UDP-4-amino-4,6-dideoxy-N-acetyl-beta-L-altrosamine transaminase [Opitutaceae bacterium]